jgi:hypothetical protein
LRKGDWNEPARHIIVQLQVFRRAAVSMVQIGDIFGEGGGKLLLVGRRRAVSERFCSKIGTTVLVHDPERSVFR